MLTSVHIENIALIKSLDVSFDSGFSAFTGETGAGKSIVIDSIGMVCGAKVGKELIRNGETEARVEGLFSDFSEKTLAALSENGISPDEDGCLYIVRSLSVDGKSNVTVNGKRIPLSLLRSVSPYLLNLHGQHDNAVLLDAEKHLDILDSFAENDDARSAYVAEYTEWRDLCKRIDELSSDEKEKKRKIDILKFQIAEIRDAKLSDGEEEKLRAEKNRLRHSEKINKNASLCYSHLYESTSGLSAVDSVERARAAMLALSGIIPEADDLASRLETVKYELVDIAETAADFADEGETDPTAALDKIEARLDKIAKLCSRYGADIAEVRRFCEECEKQLQDTELSEEHLAELKKAEERTYERLLSAAKALSDTRKSAAERLSKEVESELSYLDMRSTRFDVRFVPCTEPTARGTEKAEFLLRTNSGEGFAPLSKTASGGELSRVMLALKSVLADKEGADTLIFDEIDTGISGSTSRRIGRKLHALSQGRRVLCVTHSAQVASLADTHYKIEKHSTDGRTITEVRKLSGEERVREIARIISGMEVTPASLDSARELIENSDADAL